MALLTCPDCGGNVSSKAAKCPRCGCPMSVIIQETQEQKEQQTLVSQVVPGANQPAMPEQPTEPERPTEPVSSVNVQKQTAKPTNKKTETGNQNAKLIVGGLIAVAIIVAIVVFTNKSSDDSGNYYDTSQYEPSYETITVNGVSFKMIKVEGGTFQMGGSDSDAYDDEKPVHSVTLSDFYIGETEVTQSLWQAVMGGNPSYFQNGNLPVEDISWYDCQEFIQRLNAKTGKKFCMPTEAQWEYAALGGKMRKGYKYSGSNSISSVGWYDSNCNETTHNVKSLVANELGLYDMTGNVYEWCQDWYADKYDCNSATDPTGPYSGTLRVVRSGSWKSKARNCRTAYRFKYTPEYHFRNLGLRLCISPNAATVDNSDAIFRQRLMDFKKKITSTPFERDATECVKTIDNEHYKYLFFLGNITKDDDGDFDYYFGCIFCYNAVSGQVFKLQNGQFTQCSETNVSRKMLGWRYDETNRNANNGCGYGLFDIKDYSSKGFCILQFNGVGDSGLFKIDMSDLSTHFLNGETVQDKYIVEYGKRWGPEIGPIDTRTIKKVIDLSTGQEIGNPFIKAGTVSFSGQNNTQVNLTIDKSASVTGYVTYKGQPYNVISGNQTINGDINLKVDYVDGVGVDCFIIKKNGGRYILKGVYLDVWEAEEKFNMEILKQ